jgi:hypothetical protein
MEDLQTVNLLLMQNTIKCKSSSNIFSVFDLKGSMINRYVKITKKYKPTSTLKDMNFLDNKKEYKNLNTDFLKFESDDIKLINKQI